MTLTSEMHFVRFHFEIASCLLTRCNRKYAKCHEGIGVLSVIDLTGKSSFGLCALACSSFNPKVPGLIPGWVTRNCEFI